MEVASEATTLTSAQIILFLYGVIMVVIKQVCWRKLRQWKFVKIIQYYIHNTLYYRVIALILVNIVLSWDTLIPYHISPTIWTIQFYNLTQSGTSVCCIWCLSTVFAQDTFSLTLCMLGNFASLFVIWGFFFFFFSKINFFKKKNLSGTLSGYQTVWIQIRPNSLDPDQAQHLLGLIWVQTVCKGYKQTRKVATGGES